MLPEHFNSLETSIAVSGFLSPEFVQVRRYQEGKQTIVKLMTGQYYATKFPETISTTLGSCIAVCVRDKIAKIGGMNHFLLPDSFRGGHDSWEHTPVSSISRYGNVAMERLINIVLTNGGHRDHLEFKLFGGGNVLKANINIGEQNILFVKSYLRTENFIIAAQDLGGNYPRKVLYRTDTGEVFIRRLGASDSDSVSLINEETRHLDSLRIQPIDGKVDLFTSDDTPK